MAGLMNLMSRLRSVKGSQAPNPLASEVMTGYHAPPTPPTSTPAPGKKLGLFGRAFGRVRQQLQARQPKFSAR
jgi:hypothetical protein